MIQVERKGIWHRYRTDVLGAVMMLTNITSFCEVEEGDVSGFKDELHKACSIDQQ